MTPWGSLPNQSILDIHNEYTLLFDPEKKNTVEQNISLHTKLLWSRNVFVREFYGSGSQGPILKKYWISPKQSINYYKICNKNPVFLDVENIYVLFVEIPNVLFGA